MYKYILNGEQEYPSKDIEPVHHPEFSVRVSLPFYITGSDPPMQFTKHPLKALAVYHSTLFNLLYDWLRLQNL